MPEASPAGAAKCRASHAPVPGTPGRYRALRLGEKAPDLERLQFRVEDLPRPRLGPGQCLVAVHAAAVNPSDAKAALGLMPHAVWPRTPGRDFAGTVIEGPPRLLGLEVWGSGGDLGIRREGTHARLLVLDEDEVRAKPARLSLIEAAGIGVPFVTALEGFRAAGGIGAGAVVLVMGAQGKVGQAAVQIASMKGARVMAVVRRSGDFSGHAAGTVEVIDAASEDVARRVQDATAGHGADIVFNTVGSPYFDAANKAMALGGRQILISTFERTVPFDILEFYRGRRVYVGIDTLALDAAASARLLEELRPGFEAGLLKPFPVAEDSVFPLEEAASAYQRVMGGAGTRVFLMPEPAR
ncbi:MAG: zinc-binding alcohol dehydrogenase family protein [Proteobacteria bacterium]|nr:zinc-binding alcohol dehydrogenase family protein [Pseudomonadota bacterium]MBI3497745.1 zinc-binding alcohol dehydrogenase family protein [Pseudomonadota bacterium]